MRRTILAAGLLTFLPIGPLEFHLLAQTTNSNEGIEQPEDASDHTRAEVPAATEAALRGVMILRVSERYLEELFARDIDKQSPVMRIVLGTRARGTAHTKGRADVDTKPDQDDAVFDVLITGSTRSRTVGRNARAIIHSYSVTEWTCLKMVRFNGKEFVTSPTTIKSETRITPLGADSSLPGLRGRIVRRIAARRAVQYNQAAERIVNGYTEKQVLEDVDRIIEERIAKLNQRVESRSLLSFLLPKFSDAGAEFSTSSNCINIIFGGGKSSPLARVCPVEKSAPSDTELWIQAAFISRPEGEHPNVFDDARSWLFYQLPKVQILGLNLVGEVGVLPMQVEFVDDWIVFRSRDNGIPAAPSADKQVRAN